MKSDSDHPAPGQGLCLSLGARCLRAAHSTLPQSISCYLRGVEPGDVEARHRSDGVAETRALAHSSCAQACLGALRGAHAARYPPFMSHASHSPDDAEPAALCRTRAKTPHPVVILAAVWVLSLAAVAAGRFRHQWDAYLDLHRWCDEQGVPGWLRNLDSLLLFGGAAFAGAGLVVAWRGGSVGERLLLRRGRPARGSGRGWGPMVVLAILPMVAGGAVLGSMRWTAESTLEALLTKLVGSVFRAPVAEELLFRGLLVSGCAAVIGWRGTRFWANAIAAALLFAAMHVSWDAKGLSGGWSTLLMTGAGALWYTWLLARWETLWVPMVLHAGMNLGWLLAGASGGAGGGGWIENLLRAATIVIATWWTVRQTDPR